jgi:hypothetical protein
LSNAWGGPEVSNDEIKGMTLDFSVEGKVKVIMKDYIQEDMLEELPSDMDGEAVNPAGEHLFTANENHVPLDEATSQMFHTNTAKLLFLSKRARPDVQPAVAYLMTRVKSPDSCYKIPQGIHRQDTDT